MKMTILTLTTMTAHSLIMIMGSVLVIMFADSPVVTLDGHCVLSDQGMDLTNTITIKLEDGTLASLQSSAMCVGDNQGVIAGSEANIVVDDINNPQTVTLMRRGREVIETIRVPQQITGYEYEFEACRRALISPMALSQE